MRTHTLSLSSLSTLTPPSLSFVLLTLTTTHTHSSPPLLPFYLHHYDLTYHSIFLLLITFYCPFCSSFLYESILTISLYFKTPCLLQHVLQRPFIIFITASTILRCVFTLCFTVKLTVSCLLRCCLPLLMYHGSFRVTCF